MKQALYFLIPVCVLCGVLAFLAGNRSKKMVAIDNAASGKTYAFFVFNTKASITVFDRETKETTETVHQISQCLSQLHDTVNAFDPASELSQLNREAAKGPFKCSDALWNMLKQSETAWKMSDGLFDITVGPLTELWRFHVKQNRYPEKEGIAAILAHVGFDKLQLDNDAHTVKFSVPGMQVDFGGIAKGFAIACIKEIADQRQLKNYRLDFGGNIYSSQDLTVAIQDPRAADNVVYTVTLQQQCIATSGNYEQKRYINGKLVGHIIDPRTGYPCDTDLPYESVTAVTPSPTLSDVYSTTAFVGGFETAKRLARSSANTYFVFVSYDNQNNAKITVVNDKYQNP